MQDVTLNTLFTTAQVAKDYGITQDTVKDHLKNHSDELIENIHFIICKNERNRPLIKWTLKGIVVLGFFIRSPQAKNFRIWASNQLEKELLRQAEELNATRKRNLELTDKVAELEAYAISEKKHNTNIINGYKSQIAQRNKANEVLKAELVIAKNKLAKFERTYNAEVVEKDNDPFKGVDLSDPKFKPFTSSHPSYMELFKEYIGVLGNNNALKIIAKDYREKVAKEKQIVLNLAKIQKELEKNYTAIGAVMSYVNDDDRYFLENNEITKG